MERIFNHTVSCKNHSPDYLCLGSSCIIVICFHQRGYREDRAMILHSKQITFTPFGFCAYLLPFGLKFISMTFYEITLNKLTPYLCFRNPIASIWITHKLNKVLFSLWVIRSSLHIDKLLQKSYLILIYVIPFKSNNKSYSKTSFNRCIAIFKSQPFFLARYYFWQALTSDEIISVF